MVTWSSFTLPEACQPKTLKKFVSAIKTTNKKDFILMSADSFAQVFLLQLVLSIIRSGNPEKMFKLYALLSFRLLIDYFPWNRLGVIVLKDQDISTFTKQLKT